MRFFGKASGRKPSGRKRLFRTWTKGRGPEKNLLGEYATFQKSLSELIDAISSGKVNDALVNRVDNENRRITRIIDATVNAIESESTQNRNEFRRQLLLNSIAHHLRGVPVLAQSIVRDYRAGYFKPDYDHLAEHMAKIQEVREQLAELRVDEQYIRAKLENPIELKKDDLNEFMTDAKFRLERTFKTREKNVKIEMNVPSETVFIARTYLAEVMNELCANAVHHTPKGGKIMLRARTEKGKLIMEVEDTGTGMSWSNLLKLRAGMRFTTRKDGTGSGLWINRMMLKEIGGKLAIESKLGKGTKVTVTVPNIKK